MTSRRSEAIWIESKSYWQIKVQRDGKRRSFYSSLKGRKGKHEAEAKADAWLQSAPDSNAIRVSDAYALFLKDVQSRCGSSNYQNHEQAGRIYILPVVGTMKLSDVTVVDWRRCISEASKHGLSRRSLLNIRASIMALLSFADDSCWAYRPVNAKKITIPNSAAPEKPKTILQPQDIRVLFSDDTYTRSNKTVKAHYIHMWRFIVVTGLRRGEAIGLRWEDVFDGAVHVCRSINEQGDETFGKNDNARRTFALTDIARAVLNDQRVYLKSIGIISPWVFPDEDGARAEPRIVYGRWHTYSTQHGFKTSIHELRHTFVSLSKQDLPLELMKSVVGHSTSMDTYGIYGHDVDGEAKRAAEIIDGVFDHILQPTCNPFDSGTSK